jgi:hypothetical protein
LPLPLSGFAKIVPQLAERALSPNKSAFSRRDWLGDFARGVFANTSDKLVPPARERLDECRMPRVVTESVSNVKDVALQNLGLNVRVGPDCIEKFVLRHQAARVFHKVSQNGVWRRS